MLFVVVGDRRDTMAFRTVFSRTWPIPTEDTLGSSVHDVDVRSGEHQTTKTTAILFVLSRLC